MLETMIENTKDLNMVADRLRARGEISRLQELCRERLIPENDMQDFLQGKRLRLAEVPLEEKNFSTASEKIAEEMYQFEGPGLAVALGQYLDGTLRRGSLRGTDPAASQIFGKSN